ncbi:hepatocyte growth factor receptor-like isoform X1 [Asterias rubens]|uniref:hepatocyte growth factor receptor-like isoform X1 n=1 Tax=Asterias rubens TaxID=7604 RepID=UPI00145510A5|nr:hepatocyte growth factor receptor-like isoform X1 [Asterias rubens]XP_033644036.1 hepatocyte growth factor receptor-like isoform X1 [Asterias rubens]XP_033644044.1 hepatocyte growth factor receptor-like isoform X1 [Asterias rubens]
MAVQPNVNSPKRCRWSDLQRKEVVLFLVIVVLHGLLLPASCLNQRLVETLTHFSSPNVALQHLFVHRDTGEIYVGGTNKLYHFSSDLDKLSEVDTRQEGIIEFCPTVELNRCPVGDNLNRVLQVDYSRNLLIACGSDFYGTCALHDVSNFTRIVGWPPYVHGGEIPNQQDSLALGESVVSYFAQYQDGNGGAIEHVLYIGATFNSDPRYQNVSQHAATAKKLKMTSSGEWQFSFASQEDSYYRNSFINVIEAQKHDYKIKYIYGFNSGDFNYFTTVQREDVDLDNYQSRIVRICNRDKNFFSYTEAALICRDSGNKVYNILNAAYVGTLGANLQGFDSGEEVLFGVFSTSVSEDSDQPGRDSALCLYQMSYINKRIQKGLQECFNGDGTQGLKFFSSDRDCSSTPYRVVSPDFCGTGDLQPIEARKTILGRDQLRNGGAGRLFTAVSVVLMGGDTVAIIGTQDGHIMKFLLQSSDNQGDEANVWARKPYKDLDLSNGPVLSDMVFDADKKHVYAMTSHEVFKIAISSCEHYVDCSACALTHDPKNCGWCGFCSTQQECTEQGGTSTWQQDSCPPAIYGVTPLAGPLKGGTQVTITGDNLGQNVETANTHEVTVAGKPCNVIPERSEIYRIVCKTSPSAVPTSGPIVAKIEVLTPNILYTVNGTISSEPTFIFEYVDPVLESVDPGVGGVSGGTRLILTGNGLNAGNNITVLVVGQPCLIESVNMTVLICNTGAAASVGLGDVEVQIDSVFLSKSQTFTYVEDPRLERISRNKAIVSGGQTILVFGMYLQYIRVVQMRVTIADTELEDNVYMVICTVIADDLCRCISPNINQSSSRELSDQPIRANVTFFLDNKLTELANGDEIEFLFYPDPKFEQFAGRVRNISNSMKVLTIGGRDMNLALTKNDIRVLIGGKVCPIIDLEDDEVTCQIPDLADAVKDPLGYKVEIQAGSTSTTIEYVNILQGPFAWYGILIAMLIVLCIIVALIVKCVRQQAKHVDNRLAAGVIAPTVMFRQNSRSGGESAEARVLPPRTLAHVNNYMRTPSSSAEAAFAGTADENRPLLETINKDLAMLVSEVLITEDNLKQGEVVGQGHFGCVYLGKLWQEGSSFQVAIKTLLRGETDDISNFLREGIMMKDFKHPHVLQLIGVCINKNNLPLVVLPYMKNGDLLTFVRDPTKDLTARDLLEFSRQVADGMSYLADLKFVHRDLAARNCMLDDTLLVKIADFGLSRDIYERDYYSAKDKTAKLPVKWMALECLERSVYSIKTDVWSFGVVMWELLTRGMSPYPAVDNWDISSYLQRGRRLQQPMHCPDHVYQVMLDCWSVSPVDRPTFEALVCQLTDILSTPTDQQTEEDQVYLNVIPKIH